MPDPDAPTPVTPLRLDWRDLLRNAADLALLGIVTTLAAAPVLTAPAAVATASAATGHWIERGYWPGVRPALRDFGRALLPGVAAGLVVGAVAALFALNLLALANGVVPGGSALIAVTAGLAALAGGLAGLIVVELGRQGGHGWRRATRSAIRLALDRPVTLLAVTGVLALGIVLCGLVLPPLTPILAGYLLFGLHAVVRRTGRN